jgi:hypothetical protein
MEPREEGREMRSVLVYTLHGTVEGDLPVNSRLRTLDFLNAPHKFVTLEATKIAFPGWSFDTGPLSLNKEMILFVTELGQEPPTTDERVEAAHFLRSAVRLRLADFDVQGYMHVRGLNDPLMRLSQNRQTFLALTAASVVGKDTEFATGFLAVNPLHVLAAQMIHVDEAVTRSRVGTAEAI